MDKMFRVVHVNAEGGVKILEDFLNAGYKVAGADPSSDGIVYTLIDEAKAGKIAKLR